MPITSATDRADPEAPAGRCYGCFRKLPDDCFCADIPHVNNRTDVLILQHVRERFHPFNTARIVRKALTRSHLLVTLPQDLAAAAGPYLKPGAGLLYPGPQSMLLSELSADQFPQQLVILDGTWHQTKTLVRDNPALAQLPQYRLAPDAPSRYRIRREPTAEALSTVEATIAALSVLEPETEGFDRLMQAFVTMIDRQVDRPKTKNAYRSHRRRRATPWNIPSALLGSLDQVAACYGESPPGALTAEIPARPIYWVAQRIGTGERFARVIQPEFALTDELLAHLELTRADFEQAVSFEEAQADWSEFLRADDTLTVFNQGVARLLKQMAPARECFVAKSVQIGPHRRCQTLDEILAAESITPPPAAHPGRAGKRLANLIAWVERLNACGRPS